MKVSLSFEKTESNDVSIMVDAFRASTSITIALNKFKKVIPAFSPEIARKIAIDTGGILAGEKDGVTIEDFDLGNSPVAIENYQTDEDTLILSTSNGTRILENMNSTVLIGCFLNAESVAKQAIKIATSQIDLVMAGWKGKFAIEDFLSCGEIISHIMKSQEENKNCKVSEYAQSAMLASRNDQLLRKTILNTRAAKRLAKLGFKDDVEFSLRKNVSQNVAIYKDGELTLSN